MIGRTVRCLMKVGKIFRVTRCTEVLSMSKIILSPLLDIRTCKNHKGLTIIDNQICIILLRILVGGMMALLRTAILEATIQSIFLHKVSTFNSIKVNNNYVF